MSGGVRSAVVSGSASGIGAALRRILEGAGWKVTGIDRAGAEIVADLSEPAGRRAAVEAVVAEHASGLDALVAGAGLGPHVTPTDLIARVNYFGAVRLLDELLPVLARGDRASAVAISSNSAGIIPPDEELLGAMLDEDEAAAVAACADLEGATVYGVSKLALARAVRHRAKLWGGEGVRLNAVAPGPVMTPLLEASLSDPRLGPLVDALPVPLERRAHPDEIAAVIAFLLDPAQGYVHGSVVFCDGGTDAMLRPDSI